VGAAAESRRKQSQRPKTLDELRAALVCMDASMSAILSRLTAGAGVEKLERSDLGDVVRHHLTRWVRGDISGRCVPHDPLYLPPLAPRVASESKTKQPEGSSWVRERVVSPGFKGCSVPAALLSARSSCSPPKPTSGCDTWGAYLLGGESGTAFCCWKRS
jgi:hypothetical protein